MSDAGYMLPAISLIVALNAQFIGTSLGVIDHPLRSHKTHDKPTPLVGGFAVVLPLLTYCMIVWWVQPQSVGHAVFAFAIGGAFGLGFMDDRNQLPSLFRLIFVVVLTLIVFSMMPGLVVRVFDFAFLSEPIFLAPFSIAFSVLVVVGMVNAINMTDGMNGLACGLGLIWSLFLLFYAPPEYLEVVVCWIWPSIWRTRRR